jgi:DNA mismatch repair protein MLH3
MYACMFMWLLNLCSEDELLCTVPSSSPLPLISNGFGKDISCSLHEIFDSDQLLSLSGFISGPCDAFSTKVNSVNIYIL